MKRIYSIIVGLLMSCMLFASVKVDDLYYVLYEDTKTATVTYPPSTSSSIYHGKYDLTTVDVPVRISYGGKFYVVTSIGMQAFEYASNLVSITIPYTVTRIDMNAFNSCSKLLSITIPNGVTFIGQNAFQYCYSLTSVIIPNSVTNLGESAFSGCSSLNSITIPNSITSMGDHIFLDCMSLDKVYFTGTLDEWCYKSWNLYSSRMGKYDLYAQGAKVTNVTIPSNVRQIADYCFVNCKSLGSVSISNGTTHIGKGAFSGCRNLAHIFIPQTVTIVGQSAFSGCTSLMDATIPQTLTNIGNNAFLFACNIAYASGQNLLPWGSRSVNGYVDGKFVYSNNSKSKLLACSSSTTGDMNVPNSVTRIGEYAFYYCDGLTSINIPNSVTYIEHDAFIKCSSTKTITIGDHVQQIESQAFSDCDSLRSIICKNSTPPTVDRNTFYGLDCSKITLYVPNESILTYLYDEYWQKFDPILPLESLESVENTSIEISISHKVARDGQILILRGDKTYTLTGQEVK